ncbi:MAG: indolepyruvate ferredoxin oxidoreductase subunit alpha [Deltaproteobacteria bacterium]|nr:indolepyruvate ferredoxin oxidoreductase subunit alpha [Deltaproteobacteria bacterium]
MSHRTEQRILMGNEAIGRGLVEEGCTLAAAYPGTPASEILSAVVAFAKETGSPLHAEWSVNEKVACETALANSMAGRRSAVAMKQVGLNVAADPFTRAAYLGVKGGFILIAADDPGPHSSQTEQDSRLFAHFAKAPVFDPASPREAREMVGEAFALSEKYEIPVVLRPTTRVCHARQNVACRPPQLQEQKAHFEKNPGRWVATPQFLTELHRLLNEKLDRIADETAFRPTLLPGGGERPRACVVASGVAFAHASELLADLGPAGKVDLFQVRLAYPLHKPFIEEIRERYDRVLVLEETDAVIEMQLGGCRIGGRGSGDVPRQGELTPDLIEGILQKFLDLPATPPVTAAKKGIRPSLCAGCGHRAAFYAIRNTFPKGIFPSDIGCYTLGMNFGAVDTCHCMGACIGQGAGFYHAYAAQGGDFPTIVVTIGDSTFFHAGIPGLINAVFQGARFILVILDNATTAMTGHQPTPQLGIHADGSAGRKVLIPDLVRACGIRHLREIDPYDVAAFTAALKEADAFIRSVEGDIAVLIAKHPCIVDRAAQRGQAVFAMEITEECVGCRACIDDFECPAILFDEAESRTRIDPNRCIGCGVCVQVCPAGAIRAEVKS